MRTSALWFTILTILFLSLAACGPGKLPWTVDCSALTGAAQHHLDQLALGLPDDAVIAIRPESLTNPRSLQQDLRCFFDKKSLRLNGIKAQDSDIGVVDMVVTYKPADGQPQLTPVLAVFNPNVPAQELIPAVMFGESSSKEVAAVQVWPDRWEVNLSPVAVVQDGQVLPLDGAGLEPLKVVKQLDFSGEPSYQIVSGERNVPISEADLGGLALGGWILGAFDEAGRQAAVLATQTTEIGFMPVVTEAVGVPGTGQTEGSFAPDRSVIDSLNSQGFMVVESQGGVLCFDRNGSKIPVVTEKVMDPRSPEKVYQLVNLVDGRVVPVMPGESPQVSPDGFVLYGEQVDGQWLVRQKELVVMPDVFPGLECAGVIVNDQTKLPQNLIDLGYQYFPGTKMYAIVDPKSGEILGLAPTIYDVDDQVTIGQDHGVVRVAVANGLGEKVFELKVAQGKLIPAFPPEIKASLEQRFGKGLVITSGDGVNTATIADRQVGVTINNEWVVLPEDSATRHVPPDAQLIINSEGKAVVFGAATPLYQWNSEAGDWVLDMSTVDVRQFSAWAYDLAYQQFGDPAQTKIKVGQYYWQNIKQPELRISEIGGSVLGGSARYSVWIEGVVEVSGSAEPSQELALVSWLKKDNQGKIVRELGLGWARIAGEPWQVRVTISSEGVEDADIRVGPGDLAAWQQILGQMVGRNAKVHIVYKNNPNKYCDGSLDPSPMGAVACGLGKWMEAGTSQGIDFFQVIKVLGTGRALDEPLVLPVWIVPIFEGALNK